jgi:hypothetical protein
VRSRRDLVRKIFITHYESRFRDNEAHARTANPRGGPDPASATIVPASTVGRRRLPGFSEAIRLRALRTISLQSLI